MNLKKIKKGFYAAMGFAMAAAVFTGCGSKNDNTEASAETSAPSTTAEASDEKETVTNGYHTAKDPYNGDNVKIAYVPNTGSAANAQAWEKGIRQVLEPLNEIYGTIELNVFDPNGNGEQQQSILSDLCAQNYDALIIQCVDGTAIVPSIQECEEAGMAVISLNVSPSTQHAARFGFGGYTNGYAAGIQAAERLGGKGNVVIVGVPPEVTQAVGDCPWVGFQDALATYPDIKILEEQAGDFTAENANEIMRDFLTKYDEIDLAWCSNDEMAEGAALAIQSAGREGIAVWGADGETKALEYIEQGLMEGTIFNDPITMGNDAAKMALYCIMSEADQNFVGSSDYAPSIMLPSTVVTKDNVAEITNRW